MGINTEATSNMNYLLAAGLGLLGMIIFIAHLNETELPFISDDKGAFLTLSVIGFLMCSLAMNVAIEDYGWTDIFVVLSSLLGILVVFLVGIVVFNLPFISTDRDALNLLVVLLGMKVLLTNSHRIFDLLGILY